MNGSADSLSKEAFMTSSGFRPIFSSTDLDAVAVGAIEAAALQENASFSIAIVDVGGHLLRFERQTTAPLFSVTLAQDKAHTAVTTGRDTAEWAEILDQNSVVAKGLANLPRFTPLPGGRLIMVNGLILGAVGVSGGHWSQDDAVAQAAVTSISYRLG